MAVSPGSQLGTAVVNRPSDDEEYSGEWIVEPVDADAA